MRRILLMAAAVAGFLTAAIGAGVAATDDNSPPADCKCGHCGCVQGQCGSDYGCPEGCKCDDGKCPDKGVDRGCNPKENCPCQQ